MARPLLDRVKNQTGQAPMALALDQARLASGRGEVPVGAIITGPDGAVLAAAGNQTEADHDPSAHAELLAMRQAAKRLGTTRLTHCDLWVTLEPCPMCAGAASLFRIRRLVFAAYDPKGGGVEHGPRLFQAPGCLHVPEVIGGVRESESGDLLKAFFRAKR